MPNSKNNADSGAERLYAEIKDRAVEAKWECIHHANIIEENVIRRAGIGGAVVGGAVGLVEGPAGLGVGAFMGALASGSAASVIVEHMEPGLINDCLEKNYPDLVVTTPGSLSAQDQVEIATEGGRLYQPGKAINTPLNETLEEYYKAMESGQAPHTDLECSHNASLLAGTIMLGASSTGTVIGGAVGLLAGGVGAAGGMLLGSVAGTAISLPIAKYVSDRYEDDCKRSTKPLPGHEFH
jgi:hypothetical protein